MFYLPIDTAFFPLFCSSFAHLLMEISIDLRVKPSAWILFAPKSQPKQSSFFLSKQDTIKVFSHIVWEPVANPYLCNYARNSGPTSALPILSKSIRCRNKCQAPPVSYSSTLSISLSLHLSHFQSSINVISSCTCLHYDYFSPLLSPPQCPPLCSRSAQPFLLFFHLYSIILLLSQAILHESFLLFSPLRNHTIGLATSVSF